MRVRFPLAAMLGAFIPATAFAATGDIRCIENRLGTATMARIGDGVVAAADKGSDPSASLDADRDALIAARDWCRRENNWSAPASLAAVSYTQARATRIGVQIALEADRIPLSRLNDSYAALAITDRQSMIRQMSPRALEAIRIAAGGNVRARRHIALYLASLAAFEFYPAEFAAG